MAKPLAEYNWTDWLHLRPILHFIKSRRYRLIDRAYSRQIARRGESFELASAVRWKKVLVSIAYDDVEVIDWQARLVRAFVPNALYMIADNSRDPAIARQIALLARRNDVPYIQLPLISWNRALTSRSHGLALNWVWRNIIRRGEPEAFGFLDHDIFPTLIDDPFRELDSQAFFGHVRRAGDRWFLWAGFCMFRFDAVKDLQLDFGQDWFKGLDTGGGNWSVLYHAIDSSKLRQPTDEWFHFECGRLEPEARLQLIGPWLHEVGVRDNDQLKTAKRRSLEQMLRPLLDSVGQYRRLGSDGAQY
jgi:hypothetical protein